jgi:hypothetical protein
MYQFFGIRFLENSSNLWEFSLNYHCCCLLLVPNKDRLHALQALLLGSPNVTKTAPKEIKKRPENLLCLLLSKIERMGMEEEK